jgi:hypothetical protein
MMRHARHPHRPPPLLGPVSSLLPVGAIIAYAGQLAVAPDSTQPPPALPPNPPPSPQPGAPHTLAVVEAWGWMLCNGRALSCSDYSELYASLGGLYGTGGSDATFRIPDLRGYFLRGADPLQQVDKEAQARTPIGTGQAADVGSRQQCALQDHVHAPMPGGLPMPQGGPAAPAATGPTALTGPAPATAQVLTSLVETRPVNISVHYLIRFTNRLYSA